MSNRVYGSVVRAVLLGALVLLPVACGGGGGPGDPPPTGVTLADLEGGWSGPTGVAALGGGPLGETESGGITADNEGHVTGTGTLSGINGTATVRDALTGVYHFSGSGRQAMLMIRFDTSTGGRYLAYLDDARTFGALQRDAVDLDPPYDDADVRDTVWAGALAGFDVGMNPTEQSPISGLVDPTGILTLINDTTTDGNPITLVDATLGHFQGDYVAPPPSSTIGVLQFLISPDREFLAGFSCNGPPHEFPEGCRLSVWMRR